jgi:hypothetical protein
MTSGLQFTSRRTRSQRILSSAAAIALAMVSGSVRSPSTSLSQRAARSRIARPSCVRRLIAANGFLTVRLCEEWERYNAGAVEHRPAGSSGLMSMLWAGNVRLSELTYRLRSIS